MERIVTDTGSRASNRSSLVDEAYAELRARIVDGRIPPGSRITVRPIAGQLQLSATPIKAALVMLEREGVIVSHLHRGFFVPELSQGDMREIYELRTALDWMAAQLAARTDDRTDWAAKLFALCDLQAGYLADADIDGYRQMDVDFHRMLWIASHNSRILRAGEPLLDQMLLGNALSARQPGRGQESLGEHQGIVEAIRVGDAELAAQRAVEHIRLSEHSFELALNA
jgi:DNA-binding GntR family transcriptional regulator